MKSLKKKFIPFISTLIFILSFSFIIEASVNPVVDDAKLLSQDEINELKVNIENFRENYNMDVVIVTSNDLQGKTPRDYADDYYDYNGYGLGDNKSGLLLLIDMDDRKIWISTSGDAIEYFTDNRIDSIVNDISKYLSNEEYFDACNIFLTDIQYYIDNGFANVPQTDFNYRYFMKPNLKNVILEYGKNSEKGIKKKEKDKRLIFYDFLNKILKIDPEKRLTPAEALKHNFITSDFSTE